MDNSQLLLGRPYGGCGILFRKSLAPFISRLKCCSTRFCALSLTTYSSSNNSIFDTLLINLYLPTDYGTLDSNNAFLESLGKLDGFISTQSFDNLIICGDFNVDFSRDNHNCYHLKAFMHSHNLTRADICSNIQYTYRRDDHTSFSWPDHILTLHYNVHLIQGVACIDSVDNFSDHLPLAFDLILQAPMSLPSVATASHNGHLHSDSLSNGRVDWNKVSPDHSSDFCSFLDDPLPTLPDDLVACCDPKCKGHFKELDLVCNQILDSVQRAALLCLPKVRKYGHLKPGWNTHARPFRPICCILA